MATPSTGSSRKGRKLSTAACDLCRLRKVQCIFAEEADRTCKRCLSAGVDCTFLRGHRPRGRVSRHVTAAREQKQSPRGLSVISVTSDASTPWLDDRQDESQSPENALPESLVPNIGVTHLCPLSCMALILTDFRDYLYPVLPFVHLPTLMAAVNKPLNIHEPGNRSLFQTVMAVAAATIASIPRRLPAYSSGRYASVQAMVDRATRLVHLSRGMSDTPLDDDPSLGGCVTSMVLSLAAYYTGRSTTSRILANESILNFRTLKLYQKQKHESLTGFESEICKRLFWLLYINQIHDRIDAAVPRYPLCFDPLETDWEFMIPRENEDELHFYANSPDQSPPDGNGNGNGNGAETHRPIVSGFCALLRVYFCVVDVFSADFPRPPQSILTAKPLSMEPQADLELPSLSSLLPFKYHIPGAGLTLESVISLVHRLKATMEHLPAELLVEPEQVKSEGSRHDAMQALSRSTMQRLIIAANIRMTSLFVQSTTLETFSGQLERKRDSFTRTASTDAKIWELRELFASQTLDILQQFPQEALEANGSSLILKARKIAATLLERDETYHTLSAEATARMDGYLEQFVRTLATLDYVYPNPEVLSVPPGEKM